MEILEKAQTKQAVCEITVNDEVFFDKSIILLRTILTITFEKMFEIEIG